MWAEPCALQGCDRCCSVRVNKDLKGNLMEFLQTFRRWTNKAALSMSTLLRGENTSNVA